MTSREIGPFHWWLDGDCPLQMLASRDIDPLPLVVSGTNTPHIHGQKTTSFIGGQWEKMTTKHKKVKEINPRVT